MEQSPTTQLLNEAEKNFENYIKTPANFQELKAIAYDCEINSTECRWSLWRAFLKAFPLESEAEIRKAVKAARDYYKQKLNDFQKTQSNTKKFEDPLSFRNDVGSKNSINDDNQLRKLIEQDVERTRQDIEFFQKTEIKQMLANILFVWAKLNPTPSYRQGMNELVAVLSWVCIHESVVVASEKDTDTDLYKFLNNQAESEADIFTVFSKLMAVGQKDMYDNSFAAKNNPTLVELMKPKQKILSLVISSAQDDPSKSPSAILARIMMIQEYWLEHCDEELYHHFRKLRIEPQTFALRWIRCLLSREYQLSETVLLWDAIFAHYYFDTSKATLLELLDYLILAMLINIRDDLLSHDDESYCLQKLLKYQKVEDIRSLIELALACRDYISDPNSNEGEFVKNKRNISSLSSNIFNKTQQTPTSKEKDLPTWEIIEDDGEKPKLLTSNTFKQPSKNISLFSDSSQPQEQSSLKEVAPSNQQQAIDQINQVILSLEEEIAKTKSTNLQNSVQSLKDAIKLLH